MSLYQRNLAREISHLKNSIIRNNENIKFIKKEILTTKNNSQEHIGRLFNLIIYYQQYNRILKKNLEKSKKQVF